MQLNRICPLCIAMHLEDAGQKTALLVDPDPYLLEARWLLMSGYDSDQGGSAPCDVFQLDLAGEPRIAVLSDTLGPFQLQEVAEYVRRNWPHAGILVVGQAGPFLEDQLYDENLAGWFSPAEFRGSVERCSRKIN